jgi:hypothetical protein
MTTSPKPPYIKKVDQIGDIAVWIVDGPYIRGHVDEEFTNFGQHFAFDYIPMNEFWIDREAAHDETRFFIDHLLMEHRLMAMGVAYDNALLQADKEERKERRRAGDIEKLTHHGQQLPHAKDVHEKLWKKLENGISVWIVNGRLVRSAFDIDFTEGGHDHVYEFVPDKEVWIDDAIEGEERGFVLLHELHERNQMEKGMPYSQAHEGSSRLEYRCRHHPDELHEALAAEGWE